MGEHGQMDGNPRSGDYDGVRIALALIAIFGVGAVLIRDGWLWAVPSLLLALGAILSVTSGNEVHLRTTTRAVQGIGLLGAIFGAGYVEYLYQVGDLEIKASYELLRFAIDIALVTGAFLACWLLNLLWLKPMSRQLGSISGFLLRIVPEKNGQPAMRVRSWEAFGSYSVADELKKWHELHESGVINDQEFAEAKAKILRGETASVGEP